MQFKEEPEAHPIVSSNLIHVKYFLSLSPSSTSFISFVKEGRTKEREKETEEGGSETRREKVIVCIELKREVNYNK